MTPSISQFRAELRGLTQAAAGSRAAQHVIVLGVDGIPYALAAEHWSNAHISRMQSVFPTTSSTAWLSALTGQTVDQHGVPGVRFTLCEEAPESIDVYRYKGPLTQSLPDTIFTDATASGLSPVVIPGDLQHLDCAWRDLLLHGAARTGGDGFFAAKTARSPASLCQSVQTRVDTVLAAPPHGIAKLVWVFVDADLHIHLHGYDEFIGDFLKGMDEIACTWAAAGHCVVAHSDHGLVRTRHDPDLAAMLEQASARFDAPMGGAGRTRWFYVTPERAPALAGTLRSALPEDVSVVYRESLFSPSGSALPRVGPVVIVAQGERFIVNPDYRYEHGSTTDGELFVPFAIWPAAG